MADPGKMDRNLALEVVRVTEAAALAASRQMGRGDERMADQVAVDAMRNALNSLDIAGTVVIGEGERDEAPMLFIGEEVGTGKGPKIDIALDPLEGTTITAKGLTNSLAVIAMVNKRAANGDAVSASSRVVLSVLTRRSSGGVSRSARSSGSTPSPNGASAAVSRSTKRSSSASDAM